jgi:thiol-disulfide isomerase/thioredoxin
MIASLLALVVLWGSAGGANRTLTCEPGPELSAALAPLLASADMRQNEQQRAATRAQLFASLRARFPGDLHVDAWRIEFEKPTGDAREAFAAPYRQRAAASPSDAGAAYLAGLALNDWKTLEAIGFLNRAVALDPALAQAHAALADVLSLPAFQQKDAEKRARLHRQKAFALCPMLGLDFDAELTRAQRGRLQRLLAARLDGNPGLNLNEHPRHWQLLFLLARPRGFPEVRGQIRRQLQAIERLDPAAHPSRSSVLIEGWKLVGDRTQIRRAEDELLQREPHSEQAQAVVASRWKADSARSLAESEGWVRRWPASSWAWQQRIDAVFGNETRAPALEIPTIEGALKAVRENPQEFAWEWPLPMALAERLIVRGQHLDHVPGAVAAGLPIIEAYLAPGSDHYPRDAGAEQTRRASAMWPVWRLVSRAALKRKHAADAAAAVERLAAILAPLKPPEDWREYRAELAEARARLAQIQGRQGEALALLKQSVAERTAGKLGPLEDDLLAVAGQLMQAQGASEAAVKQWRETTTAQTRPAPRAPPTWKPQARRLPAFHLDALDGSVWSLRALRDKVVFVNVWSRGCGPCIQEMPVLNELHKRLAGRKDVVLLSINIDDEDVAWLPLFMADNGAEFPVLLGERYIERVLPEVSIPRNWVIDGRGFLRAEQVGYAVDASHDSWLASALAEIDKARGPAARAAR